MLYNLSFIDFMLSYLAQKQLTFAAILVVVQATVLIVLAEENLTIETAITYPNVNTSKFYHILKNIPHMDNLFNLLLTHSS